MKKYVSNSLKLLAGAMVGLSVPTCFGLTSCSQNSAIEFANYESYMADDLMEDLQHNYNIHFPNYTVAEMIPAKFEKFYDCAVPCGYELMALLRKGWLHEIEWSKFDITIEDASKVKHEIKTADDAQQYLYIGEDEGYTGIAQMNEQFAAYIKQQPADDPLYQYLDAQGKFQILRFGVPYFAQSYMFAYIGEELTFYKDKTTEPTTTPTWADIFYTISPANPNQDQRFKDKKIGMVDDARSFHDICRIVESQEDGEQEVTLDPIKDADVERVQKTMSHITDKFAGHQGSFVLNSDSAIVSRGLADRKGDQTAVLSWSGDTIYAAQGAEEFDSFTSEDFHIMKPSDKSFDEIEYVVINKKNEKDKNKLENIYKVVQQICLDGADSDKEEICKKEDDRYAHWAMDNWDTVMYTPMLKSIYHVVVDEESKYWEEQMEEYEYDIDTVRDLFIPILNGHIPETCQHLYGKTLTTLQNSNNHWAWLEQRGKL